MLAPLSQKQNLCTIVKFIAALLVVHFHIFAFNCDSIYWKSFSNFGAPCVSIFFFFSGYGLVFSFLKKGEAYLEGFVYDRGCKLLIPFIIAYIITLPVFYIFVGQIDLKFLIATLPNGGIYLVFSWYVTAILLLYLTYFVVMKLRLPIDIKLGILTIIVLLAITYIIIFDWKEWYGLSLPGFIIGLWYARYEHRILCATSKRFFVLTFVVSAIICLFLWQWPLLFENDTNKFLSLPIEYINNILWVIVLISGAQLLPCFVKRVNVLLYCSYEIYLLQNCAMIISGQFTNTFWHYYICTMLLSVMIGFIGYKFNQPINKLSANIFQNSKLLQRVF